MPAAARSAPNSSIRLLRIADIDVYLHWSWLLVALIELRVRDTTYTSQLWNVLEYVTLFGIVLMHEFGHALACRSVGGRADRILLWPLGGLAYVNPPQRPGALLWSIAAGPLVNVALLLPTVALAAWAVWLPDGRSDLQQYILMVGGMNAFMLVVNLLPIYPLDGGQIVRALLWFVVGQTRSLRIAAGIGFVGAAVVLAWALLWEDVWLLVLGIFGASQSINGLRAARHQAALLAMPRRSEARCPSCGESPLVGRFWTCPCGEAFDTFERRATCPACTRVFETTECTFCSMGRPLGDWLPEPSPASLVPPL